MLAQRPSPYAPKGAPMVMHGSTSTSATPSAGEPNWFALLQRCSEHTPERETPPPAQQPLSRQQEEDAPDHDEKQVEETSEESFPASDAPSWTSSSSGEPPQQ